MRYGGALIFVLAAVFCWLGVRYAPLEVSADVYTVGSIEPSGSVYLSQRATLHEHHPGGALQAEGTTWQVFTYVLKVVYYISFTLFIGWLLWSNWLRRRSLVTNQARDIGAFLQRMHFLALMGYGFVYIYDLQLRTGEDIAAALFDYIQGWSFIALFVLALAGFTILYKKLSWDLIWSLLVAAVQSLSGHSTSYELPWLTLPSYTIHWLAAAIWIGGVLFAAYLYRTQRERLWDWLPIFSRMALLSVVALAVTGTLHAVVYLPSVEYVYGTPWGRWLLVKVAAVAVVLGASLFVRRAWRRRGAGMGKLMGVEMTALVAVLLVAGLLTSQHPTPHDGPLDWHVMGEEIHMTLQLTPNEPGMNSYVVKVWLPEEQAEPHSVELMVKRGDDPPRQIGLTPVENEFMISFPGFTEHRFRGQGNQLDRPGTWTVLVKVVDEVGVVTEYEREIDVW